MTKTLVLCALALSLPGVASAGLYRCQQADGKTRFQDVPCSSAAAKASGEAAVQKAGPGKAVTPIAPGLTTYQHTELPRAAVAQPRPEDKISAANREIDAHNKAVNCNQSRHNLGVLSEQRPVYRYNNKGERQYIEDSARAREIGVAQQGVSKNCK